jgi:Fungal Zn(2)-Cys(6) binuclear cluster domain
VDDTAKSRAPSSAISENVSFRGSHNLAPSTQQQHPSRMASSPAPAPPHKHSCLLCARRKIRCDKQDPKCSNCTKSQADCVYQAPPPPQRNRKRQADEELLARLNHYEELLRSHKIDFKPSTIVLTPKSVEDTQQKASPVSQIGRIPALSQANPQSDAKSGDGQDHSFHSDPAEAESRSPWGSLSNEVWLVAAIC